MNYKHRKGLSSVVGAVFMILVMIGALNLTIWTLRQQDSVSQAVLDRTNSQLNKLNENIMIKDVRLTTTAPLNRLNITVANSGGSTAQLASIYIINETASPKTQYNYTLTDTVNGRSSVKNIGTNIAFTVKDLTNYSVRIVTKAGNSAAINIGSLSTKPLQMIMFAIPSTLAPGGGNVTLMLSINNNYTDTAFPKGISANMTYSGACTPTSLYPCTVTKQSSSLLGNGTIIAPGSTALYKWVYNVNAPDGTTYTFTAKIVNGVVGNTATARVTLKLLDASRSNTAGTTDVLSLKFLSNVGLSIVAPGPFGTYTGSCSTCKAVWGVIVSNPTGTPFNVTKVSVSVISPPGGSSDSIFNGGCSPLNAKPGTGTWSCTANNVLQWSGSAITVSSYSSQSFIALLDPGSISSVNVPSSVVTATAFTTLGQYSKTGYSTQVVKQSGGGVAGSCVCSIYFQNSRNNFTDSATLQNQVIGHLNNIPSNGLVKMNITLAQMFTAGTFKINSASGAQGQTPAKIVVSLPPGFSVVSVDAKGGFNSNVNVTTFSDTSKLIVATRTSDITGPGGIPSGTLSFTLQVPTVQAKWIYIISAATAGTNQDNQGTPKVYDLGTFAEFALQVNPPP